MQELETPIVRFEHITKEFPGVKALDDVSFSIKKGEVHCLLGENGAGKSTLIKILTGVYSATSGIVYIDDEPVKLNNIHQSRALGIGTVFQENSLIPHLTVAENIFLTREIKNKAGLIDWKKMNAECVRWGRELGVELDPQIQVRKLSVAQQQVVEIVKVFSQAPRIIILDEPTSSLSENEINNLFQIVMRMKEKGITFLYVSHRMEEIQSIGDGGTVLRDGKSVASLENVRTTPMEEIIKLIVGRDLEEQYPARESNIGEVLLEAKNLSVKGLLEDISFQVHRGEVLGFSGLVGSGRTTTAKAIFGALPCSGGEILLEGKTVHIKSPRDAIRYGLSLLPENRKEEGLFLKKSVSWNMVFVNMKEYVKALLFRESKSREDAERYKDMLQIKTPSLQREVKFLSGGNQQKVVFSKWLCAKSRIYFFDEPTRGIDVGAKSEMYRIINMLVSQGNAVVVISSELPEILGVCDRIAVFHEGRITGILDRKDATQEKIMHYALGGN